MDQILIAFTGVLAVFLTQQKNEAWKKYACLFGLAGQPFWFYAALKANQWGILVIAFLYTYAWGLGVLTNWVQPDVKAYYESQILHLEHATDLPPEWTQLSPGLMFRHVVGWFKWRIGQCLAFFKIG